MVTAIAGAIFEAFLRVGEPRVELLAFYVVLLGFGTAVPAALSLFTNQQSPSPEAPPASNGSRVSLERGPRTRQRGDGGTTSPHSRSRR